MFREWVIKSVAHAASRILKAGSRYVSGMGYKKYCTCGQPRMEGGLPLCFWHASEFKRLAA